MLIHALFMHFGNSEFYSLSFLCLFIHCWTNFNIVFLFLLDYEVTKTILVVLELLLVQDCPIHYDFYIYVYWCRIFYMDSYESLYTATSADIAGSKLILPLSSRLYSTSMHGVCSNCRFWIHFLLLPRNQVKKHKEGSFWSTNR